MSDKSKKFEPPMGWIVAINHQQVGLRHVARELGMNVVFVAQAMERAGYNVQPDYFDLSADTAKVLKLEEEKAEQIKKAESHLQVVPDEAVEETE